MRRRRGLVVFISIIQSLLVFAHFVLYKTWTFQLPENAIPSKTWVGMILALLCVSFVAASLLAFRYTIVFVRTFYRAAAVWMGLLSLLLLTSLLSWIIFGVASVAGAQLNFHRIAAMSFASGAALGLMGVFNASWTRITHARIRLENLPDVWRGRKAALISDVHLGHVRNGSFLRRMVSKILEQQPDAIFIAGDLYDGTAIDAHRAAAPLSELKAPHGVYFVAGNHEQFGDDSKYLNAVAAAGVRVLRNEKVDLAGLQLVGVPYNQASNNGSLESVLRRVPLDRNRASILLTHAPDHPDVAEAAGFSLQLSGHTHLGQFVPWSWFARRTYRQFVYGLSRIGKMQVFTSSGAGTCGPPLRLGSNPEILVIQFE
jgi:predicted MPP superfamily phosphohydrolase